MEALDLTPPLTLARRSFLTAEWRNVCLFTYEVDPEQLARYVPPGLELDLRDGKAFVSLVAFDFLHTRVLGVSWPGYRAFPEINLRFYVRERASPDVRGVVFVRKLVPKRLVAWLARALYNEPYSYAPMHSRVRTSEGALEVEHALRVRGRLQRIQVLARRATSVPVDTSTAHFFKEHTWGFGVSRRGRLIRYEVRHPVWAVHPVERYDLDWEFGSVYGREWAFLSRTQPVHVMLAEGSAVRVSPHVKG